MSAPDLERLIEVQEHDLALDRLRHRREALPERARVTAARDERTGIERELAALTKDREGILAEERRLDDEARSVGDHAAEVDKKMYSGTVTSPRELQAMQADVDMLKRHRSDLEDRELEVMERREALDSEIASREETAGRLSGDIRQLDDEIAKQEAEIDAEAATERDARAAAASGLPESLVRDYETRRAQNRGIGAARLVGVTCQACHLSIPSTEAERIRRGAGETVAYCDNCSAILIP